MSVWKKASKAFQKNHKERHQPDERKHLGILEKKKDYVRRARDVNQKKETLKLLHKRALNKNPDEFYHHMINAKVDDNMHFDKETKDEYTPEQISLMRTQDLKYIVTKRTEEMKKIEKLQSQLHLSNVEHNFKNKHQFFDKSLEAEARKREEERKAKLPDVNVEELEGISRENRKMYEELAKRIQREKELAVVQQKIEMKKHLENRKSVLPPKKVKKGDAHRAPVYVWKFERKR